MTRFLLVGGPKELDGQLLESTFDPVKFIIPQVRVAVKPGPNLYPSERMDATFKKAVYKRSAKYPDLLLFEGMENA